MINEDFIRKGNILKKHQTLPYLLAVVEVVVMRDEVVAKVLVVGALVFLERVRALQALVVATVVAATAAAAHGDGTRRVVEFLEFLRVQNISP